MREKTELAVVTMYRDLISRHLNSRAKRLASKDVMKRVRAKFDISRATVFRYLRRANANETK